MKKSFSQKSAIILFLMLIGGVLRFVHLDWGAPFFFHPDERNIASAISQLEFPIQLNPHFFAYGGLPIYLTYFLGLGYNLFIAASGHSFTTKVSFEQAIIILRFLSATLSLLIIPLMYVTGKRIMNDKTGLIAAAFTTFSVGLIQFAHFGTFELWLTCLTLLLFYLVLLLKDTFRLRFLFGLSFSLGILLATKITSLALIPLALTPLSKNHISLFHKLLALVTIVIIGTAIYISTNPYAFLDNKSFSGSITYESNVALGRMHVFYTGEFMHYTPLLFPLLHVYPFLLNPLLTLFLIPAFVGVLILAYKKRSFDFLLLSVFTTVLFSSQAVLFVQWTRYFVPTLPFIYLTISLFLTWLFSNHHKNHTLSRLGKGVLASSLLLSAVFALSYVKTAFISPDTRVEAAEFAKKHLDSSTQIISEVYDLGIVPFNDKFSQISLFNFYDLDNNSSEYNDLTLRQKLKDTDVIILPSQRLLKVRLTNARDFPYGHAFYEQLLNGGLEYRKIYQTPCDIFCQITYLGDPIFAFEQTANIFDRPTVLIFKKNETL